MTLSMSGHHRVNWEVDGPWEGPSHTCLVLIGPQLNPRDVYATLDALCTPTQLPLTTMIDYARRIFTTNRLVDVLIPQADGSTRGWADITTESTFESPQHAIFEQIPSYTRGVMYLRMTGARVFPFTPQALHLRYGVKYDPMNEDVCHRMNWMSSEERDGLPLRCISMTHLPLIDNTGTVVLEVGFTGEMEYDEWTLQMLLKACDGVAKLQLSHVHQCFCEWR